MTEEFFDGVEVALGRVEHVGRERVAGHVRLASSGESFASKSNAREAAENVKKNAGGADVVDV